MRLTEKNSLGKIIVKFGDNNDIFDVYNRLAELEDKLESRQTVELRCKVGDAIYQTDTNGTKIYCSTVQRIIIDNQRVIYCTDSVDFDERAIGKSIFLTAEAAEVRAKELQEGL